MKRNNKLKQKTKGSNLSDDKREKLREYLRNNRPKNSVNLGNSSNDKKNSNKNLEDDLNLNNSNLDNDSNLDNSQNLSNKTKSNKKDYEKEPLIIRDYNMHETAFFAVTIPVLLFVNFISNGISVFFIPKNIIFMFITLEIFLELLKYP